MVVKDKARTRNKRSASLLESLCDCSPSNEASCRQRETEARSSILNQILEPEAADRLGRIRMVKESRAQMVEDRLIMIARSGQLQQKVTEEQLKQMLASLTEHEKQSGPTLDNIKVVRKGRWDEDDLDDLLNES